MNNKTIFGGDMSCADKKSEFSDMELHDLPLAMAYVPMQCWERTFPENIALARGTVFPSLDLPFVGEALSDAARMTK